jgi:hypothetical protein
MPWQITDSFGSRSGVVKNVTRFLFDPNGGSNALWSAASVTKIWNGVLSTGQATVAVTATSFSFAPHAKFPWVAMKETTAGVFAMDYVGAASAPNVQDVGTGGLAGVAHRSRIISAGVRAEYIGPHGDGEAGVGFMLTTPFNASLPQMYQGFGSDLRHKYILYLY